jgi:nicotinate-nucleotide adenylyltransferase
MARKIGIYSGSFDPIHEGHISFAKEAMNVCKLDTIVFMPERFPRGKPNVSPISERITELEIALAETPFVVLNIHADQFTVDDTLAELEVLYPNSEFTFLVGSDVALNLHDWENIDRLTSRFAFAVGMRCGDSEQDVRSVFEAVNAQYTLITTTHEHLSSSALRKSI